MKFPLSLKQNLPFSSCPAIGELEGEKIFVNDVNFPREIDAQAGSFASANLYVIGHEQGPICAVWANDEQEALDNAVDFNVMDGMLYDDPIPDDMDYQEFTEANGLTSLGNAGELFYTDNLWMGEVEWKAERDIKLIVAIVRACAEGKDTVE